MRMRRQPLRLEILEALVIALGLGLLVAGTSEAAVIGPVSPSGPGVHFPVSTGCFAPVAHISASNDSAPATGAPPCIDYGVVAASTVAPVTGRKTASSAQGTHR